MDAMKAKPTVLSGVMLAVICLAGCASAAGARPAAANPTPTPRLVTPTSVSGSQGKGPRVISNPAQLPGGKPGSQKVALSDRVLVINNVGRRRGASPTLILIQLDLLIRNTGDRPIRNEPTFFQLLGAAGDAFGPYGNGWRGFYRAIGAHASRRGTIVFEVPAAAASGLYL